MVDHFVWLLVAALIIGLAKGGLSSAGSLAVPFLALFMNPVVAAAILLPVFVITDAVALWLYRRDFSAKNVAILVPSILFGIVLATILVPYAPEALLLAITGGIGLWAVGRRVLRRDITTQRPARVLPGFFWGTIAGITTFITHSGAPPAQAFLIPQNLTRLVFAGTMAITMAIANFAKIPGYTALGLFDDMDWSLVAILVVAGISATFLGRWMVKRMTDRVYMRVIEVLLFVLSVLLLTKATRLVLS